MIAFESIELKANFVEIFINKTLVNELRLNKKGNGKGDVLEVKDNKNKHMKAHNGHLTNKNQYPPK